MDSDLKVEYKSGDEGLAQLCPSPVISIGDVLVFLWGSMHPFLLKRTEGGRFNYLGVFNMKYFSKFEGIWEKRLAVEEFILE